MIKQASKHMLFHASRCDGRAATFPHIVPFFVYTKVVNDFVLFLATKVNLETGLSCSVKNTQTDAS